MFQQIFNQFDEMVDDEKAHQKNSNSRMNNKRNTELLAPGNQQADSEEEESKSSANTLNTRQNKIRGKKRKSELTQTRQVELALSISIILSNLSNDEKYIETLLGIDDWTERQQEPSVIKQSDESGKDNEGSSNT